jgi:hypothetical protein
VEQKIAHPKIKIFYIQMFAQLTNVQAQMSQAQKNAPESLPTFGDDDMISFQ